MKVVVMATRVRNTTKKVDFLHFEPYEDLKK
jgi:hypothetical protein